MIGKQDKVLVLAAHPDDEVLGVGGLLHRTSKDPETETHVALIATERKMGGRFDPKLSAQLKEQAREVQQLLGVGHYHFADLPDEELGTRFDALRRFIEGLRDTIRPTKIFIHSGSDINQDHQAIHHAARIAFRAQRIGYPFEMYSYEVLGSSDQGFGTFAPNYFTPLDWDSIDAKGMAMKRYTSEINNARSYEGVLHLGRTRGIQADTLYAEAFRLEVGKG